ncbi:MULTISPECIES: methyl-accepting chemotaxis protein [Bradyrhizobium]|uniref:methyl-accepting chemotaxis protein n=1 Tax=Bradyrhizobium TaxID=374 RepID=UPI0004051097|nr:MULTISPECIES: methyl-accepting chemotaxis protein [Bradyrhizobium]MBR1291746.1 HAMP domain-containing protein [Bradyrhizobium ottawaense]MBR1365268.1 HAMP domain-containing protein [Bradyrhizobium ottawaense]MDA9418666.1 chemotaxis protein [Bradyrhizobium sp. CCBAU 25360]MDA9445336.1 chemotaxis protein [Bradyrhizobium sp. CCBAU 21360]MDA9454997.1 chemotaxis protein [Bradyrhizobium sp. CCBAU 21359]
MSGISIRLTHKVMAIGLFGLIGLVAFGTIYQIGSLSQDTSRDAAEDARRLSDLNQRISQQLLEARRAEKDFQLRRDQSYAKRHAELASDITRNLDRLGSAARAAGYAAVGEKASLVRTGFERYVSEFAAVEQAEVRLGLNETLGLSGSLRTAVHGIETKLKEVDDPRLTSGMLTMRRHEKDFMLRRDPKYLDALKKTATEFSGQVEASAIPPAVKADIGKKLSKYQDDFVAWAAGAQDLTAHGSAMSKEFRTIEPVLDEIEKTVSQQYDAARAAEESMRASIKLWMWVALGCSILLVGSVSFFTGRSISTALIAMVRAMTGLAKGDMSVAIPGVGRKDEIGEMAGAVEVFRSNMAEADRLRAEQAEADARRREQRKFDMQRLADTFEGAVGEIIETVSSAATELEASSNTLTHAAERGNSLATAVAAASEEASANVQSVSSASEELTSSVSEISRQVQESARVADVAVGQAQRTNARVAELTKAASRIGDVVELINTIAAQTNLLALNATIEAARAGEAGKGFAVVATEVKALAEQTAKATGEIGQHIGAIQSATDESVGAIKEIGDTIARMSEISSTIAAAVEEQGAATQEISRNIQHAAQGTSAVSSNIADVQRGSGETGAASAQVHSAAQSLSQESNRLKSEVARFLESVRAA